MALFVLFSGIAQSQIQIENAFPNLYFNRPVDIQNAGDSTGRLFVVEQEGRIYVFPNVPSTTAAEVFLDIRSTVNSGGNEEGLLGLAFHPRYKNNGYFYVNYSALNPRRNVIARYSVSSSDPGKADPASETVILEFQQPYSNHNGGQIAFGPDGYLYIATGDGGSGGDPQGNGQNLATLLGKILRIDVDSTDPGKNYAIPGDNPFLGGGAGYRGEIWAYGLRNPWRMSFDPVTGWLWAGDVGQNKYEEVDIIERGKNYGWNIMEGFVCYNPSSGCDTAGLAKPVIDYGRSLGQSITGGHVYRGGSVPELFGEYLYGDFGTGRIWSLRYDGSTPAVNTLIANTGMNVSTFGVDETRELYFATFGGTIHRFSSASTAAEAPQSSARSIRISSIHPSPVDTHNGRFVVGLESGSQADIRLDLYNILGNRIGTLHSGIIHAGASRMTVSAGSIPAGVYLVVLNSSTGARIVSPIIAR